MNRTYSNSRTYSITLLWFTWFSKRTIRGDFGNGREKKLLGDKYDEVQKQVNLNYDKNGTTNWDNIRIY